jgi:hypothetical protein
MIKKRFLIYFFFQVIINANSISGYAYLSNQSDHSGIKVKFTDTVNDLSDSVFTDINGFYSNNVESSIFNIEYSKEGYATQTVSELFVNDDLELDPITLVSVYSNIIGIVLLSGELDHADVMVIFTDSLTTNADTVYTDNTGTYTYIADTYSTYDIQYEKVGFETYDTTITVNSDIELATITLAKYLSGEISGTLIQDGIYIINSTITIPSSQSLTIENGSLLRFDSNVDFIINGILHIDGTENNPVTLTMITTDNDDLRWGRIRFVDASSNSEISYCNITYSSNGIFFENTSNITFDNLSMTLRYQNNSSCIEGADYLTISNSTLENIWTPTITNDVKYGIKGSENITIENSVIDVDSHIGSSQGSTNNTSTAYGIYDCNNIAINNSQIFSESYSFSPGGQQSAYSYGVHSSSIININSSLISTKSWSEYSSFHGSCSTCRHSYSYTFYECDNLSLISSQIVNRSDSDGGPDELGYGILNCSDCLIKGNSISILDYSDNETRFGINLSNSTNTDIINNTMNGMGSSTAIRLTSSSSNIDIINNNIYAFSTGIETDGQNIDISYNNIYNCDINYEGTTLPSYIGVNALVNTNGDSTDFYNNISLDPIFLTTNSGDSLYLNIDSGSPCIDAGNPDQDNDGEDYTTDIDDQDPDGTRMDMGAYYYHQESVYAGPTWHVSTSGSDDNDGSEESPFATIQHGIDLSRKEEE